MTETKLKPCPFCGAKADFEYDDYGIYVFCTKCASCITSFRTRDEAVNSWNTRLIEDEEVKHETTSYSCRACKNATDGEITRLRKENQKYEDVLVEISFCCAAVDCSLEQQSEALKAIDTICKEFYSIQEREE